VNLVSALVPKVQRYSSDATWPIGFSA